jgi:hypothetical protein
MVTTWKKKYLNKKQEKKRRGLKCTVSKIVQPRAATTFTCAPGPALPKARLVTLFAVLKRA